MDPIEIASLATEQQCLEFIEKIRWPEGIRCVRCDSDRISKIQVRASGREVKRAAGGTETVVVPLRHLYECASCGCQFSATAGTLLHGTHLPLQKWFFAIALMVNAKEGISARRMKRDLRVTYKTAWYLCQRIDEAMAAPGWTRSIRDEV